MVVQVSTHIYSKTSYWINTKTHKLKWKGGTPHTNVTLIADWRGLVNHRLKPWETRKALKFLTWTRMVCFLERSTHQELVGTPRFHGNTEHFTFWGQLSCFSPQ